MHSQAQNSSPAFDRVAIEAQLDSIKTEVAKLFHRLDHHAEHRSRLRGFAHHAAAAVKARPIMATAAAAAALALGYLAVHLARR